MAENESVTSDETKKVSDDSDSSDSSGNESKQRLLEDADLTRPASKENTASTESRTAEQKKEQTPETAALGNLLAERKSEQQRAEQQRIQERTDRSLPQLVLTDFRAMVQRASASSQTAAPEKRSEKNESERRSESNLDDPNKKSEGEQRAYQILADQIKEAIRRGDQKQIRDILEPLSKAERDAIAAAYQQKHGNNRTDALASDLRSMGGDQSERLSNLLKGDGTRADDAARLALEFHNLNSGDKSAELRIREILSTQNAEDNRKLAQEYERLTGKKLSDVFKDSKLSEATKEALPFLMKGTDRSVEDNKALARMGLRSNDIQLLELGLRGSQPNVVKAREELNNDRDFVQQLNNTFKNDAVARDILRGGRISLETIANLNNGSGLFGSSNRLNLEHALRNATPDERRAYAAGRELDLEIKKTGQTPELSEQQKRDLEFFKRTQAALESIVSGRAPSSDIHSTEQPDAARIMRDKLGLKDSDEIRRLATDPNFKKEVESRLPTNPEERALLQSLIDRAAKGENIDRLSPAEQLLHEKVSGASPYRRLLTAEQMLQADPEMRERLRRLNANPGYEPVFTNAADYQRWHMQKAQDIALLNVIKGAASDASSRADHSAVRGLDPVGRSVSQLLGSGRLDALSAASLGMPADIVRDRLATADERTRNFVEQRFGSTYGPDAQERQNAEVSRLEDLLLRGGSLAGTLAAVRGKPEDLLRAIESMSPEDYERGRNPELAAQTRRDIERALNSPNVSPETRARALELYDQKVAADTYAASLDVRRSPLLVDSSNKVGLVESVASMSPRDQLRYREDPDYRRQVDEKIQKDLGGEQRLFAQSMLERLRNEGRLPTVEQMSPTERLLYRSITGGDKFQMLKDLETVLSDPEARARIRAARPGSGTELDLAIRNIALDVSTGLTGQEGSRVGFARVFDGLMREGKISDIDYVRLPLPASDRIARIASLERTEPQAAAALMALVVGRDPQMQKVLENIRSQNGEVKLSERIAAGDIKDLNSLRRELASMTPEQIKALREEYANKYGRSLDADVLAKMPEKDRTGAVAALAGGRGDGRQYYFDSLGRLADSSTGYAPDGTEATARRQLQIYAEQLQRAAFEGRNLTPQDQEILRRAFEQALSEFKGSKEEYAQRLLRYGEAAVLVAGALLISAASAGALSPAALAAIAAAGTTLTPAARVAVLKFVEGKDFHNDPNRMLKELGIGLVEGALAFGPFAIDAAIALAARSAAKAAETVRATYGLDQVARTQLDEALRKPMEEALKAGRRLTEEETIAALRAAGVSEDRIKTIAPTVMRDSNAALEQSAFQQRLAERTRSRIDAPVTPVREMSPEDGLRQLLRTGIDDLQREVGGKLPEVKARLEAAQAAFRRGDINDAKKLINEYLEAVGQKTLGFGSMINDTVRLRNLEKALNEGAQRIKNLESLFTRQRVGADGSIELLSGEDIAKIIKDDLSYFNRNGNFANPETIARLQNLLSDKAIDARVLASTFNAISRREFTDEQRVRFLLTEYKDKTKDMAAFQRNLPTLERQLSEAGLGQAEAQRLLALMKKELDVLRQGRGVLDVTGAGSRLAHAFETKPDLQAIREAAKKLEFPSEQARENFIKSANEFFSKAGNNGDHGFQVLRGADGNYSLVRMQPGNTERDSLKVFMQPLKSNGEISSLPGRSATDDQSLHLLFRRSDNGNGEFTLVEIKQGSTKKELGTEGNRILYQREPREEPFVNPNAVEDYLRLGNWRSMEEMRQYLNRLVRGVQYPS